MLLIKQGIGNWNGMGTKPNFNPRNNRGRRAIFVGPWVVTGTFRFSAPAVPMALCLTSCSNGGSVSTRFLCLRNYVAIGSSSTFCKKICICLCVLPTKGKPVLHRNLIQSKVSINATCSNLISRLAQLFASRFRFQWKDITENKKILSSRFALEKKNLSSTLDKTTWFLARKVWT